MADWLDYEQAYKGGASRVAGTVKVLRDVRSVELANTRDILVYLPPSYPTANQTYPTLYMHDGQNLFDEATSFAGEWRVDEALETLAEDGIEAIVVGVPNTGADRLHEYSPVHDARFGGGLGGDGARGARSSGSKGVPGGAGPAVRRGGGRGPQRSRGGREAPPTPSIPSGLTPVSSSTQSFRRRA